MKISPIIPIWFMIIICVFFLIIKIGGKKDFVRRIIIVFLVFVINLRIMVYTPVKTSNVVNDLNVLFVIDNSISMVAEDYNKGKTRLSAVKKDCSYIIDELYGANFSIITFSNVCNIVIPFTSDANVVDDSIYCIDVSSKYYAEGSSLNISIDNMKQQLETANNKDDMRTILFYISDGEITNYEKLKSFSELSEYVDDGAVLGYGTEEGGKMLVKTYGDKTEYLQDETSYPYVDAVSKIDEENLETIADDIGIDYVKMDKQSNIDDKIEKIKNNVRNNSSDDGDEEEAYEDIYYIFVIPLVMILGWEIYFYKRRL